MRRLATTLTCAVVLSCASGPAGSGAESAVAHDGGRLLNPELEDGRPVFISFDDHHPECFTFPDDGKESEKVECPEEAHKILHACRGSKLYANKSGPGCVCVPVSGDPPSETECPEGLDTQ